MRHLLASIALVLGLACGGAGGSPGADGPGDGGASSSCIPEGAPGNSKSVGKWCSKGGFQCGVFSFAKFCTVDFQADAPPFCTNQCSTNEDCGEDAACTTDESGRYGCTPVACLPKATPAAPAQPPDAGAPAAALSAGCQSLERCCAAPEFPADKLEKCNETARDSSETWCKLVRAGNELAKRCPAEK